MKLSELPPVAPKILLLGPPGTGKSFLCMTLGSRALYLDLDNNLRGGLNFTDKFTNDRKSIEVEQYLTDDMSKWDTWAKLKKRLYDVMDSVRNKTFKQQALVIDSLSAMSELALRYIRGNSGKAGFVPTGSPAPTTQPEWGLAIDEVKSIIVALRALPIPVILVAHTSTTLIDGDNRVGLAIFGKDLPSYIPRWCSEVWLSSLVAESGKPPQYVIQTVSTPSIQLLRTTGLADKTPMNLGLVEIFRLIGYTFPEVKP